jgi:hypothetical protein
MIRCGHTVLSMGYERPEELTLEQYNEYLIEMVEERLAHGPQDPTPITRESLTKLFKLIEEQPLKAGKAFLPSTVQLTGVSYPIPEGATVIIDGMKYVASADFTVTGTDFSMGCSVGHYSDVKFYKGEEKELGESMYRQLLRHSPSSLHSRLLQEYRRGVADRGRGVEDGEGGEYSVERHQLLISAGILAS